MILSLVEFITGYLEVEVTGGSPERFMNLCAVRRRDLWDFQPIDQGIRVKVRASEYRNLRFASKRAGCRLHIVAKKGLPFLIHRYRYRYGLLAGFCLFLILLYLLCGRIWDVQVQGANGEQAEQLIAILQQYDIREGVASRDKDWATLRQRVLADHPEYSWMSFNPQGTILYVDVSNAAKTPERVDNTTPSNLFASADGRIVELQITRGTPVVQIGDAVVKGDLLVSGATEYADGCTVFRQAGGQVIAETEHEISSTIAREQTHPIRSGIVKKRYVVTVFGKSIPLYLGSVSDDCEKESVTKRMTVAGRRLPFSFTVAKFHLTKPNTVYLTEDEAIALGTEQIQQEIGSNLAHAQIINIDYEVAKDEKSVTVKAKIFCKENITLEEKMLIF